MDAEQKHTAPGQEAASIKLEDAALPKTPAGVPVAQLDKNWSGIVANNLRAEGFSAPDPELVAKEDAADPGAFDAARQMAEERNKRIRNG